MGFGVIAVYNWIWANSQNPMCDFWKICTTTWNPATKSIVRCRPIFHIPILLHPMSHVINSPDFSELIQKKFS